MSAKSKIFNEINMRLGTARRIYLHLDIAKYISGARRKKATASLASNPLTQIFQSMWKASGTGLMTGGGGTGGKSKFANMLLGVTPPAVDKDTGEAWTEAQRWTVLLDALTFRAWPTAVSFVAHLGLSALSDTLLKTEIRKRWGKKAVLPFLAWHKATITFLEAISEISENSPAVRKAATNMPSLSAMTGFSRDRAKRKSSSRPVAPSAKASAKAKEIAQAPGKVSKDTAAIADTLAKVEGLAPVK